MIRTLRERFWAIVAIASLFLLAFAVGTYILVQQGVRMPWEARPLQLRAEITTASGVAPGQNQTVRVRGVRIGDIDDVTLRDGRAVLTMTIDDEYRGILREGSTGLLRPRTQLKDMFIEFDPGPRDAPALTEDDLIPVSRTLPDVNFDETIAQLDTDTRTYLKLLLRGAAQGLDGRGDELRAALKRFEPTQRDLARISTAVVDRRESLRRLVRSSRLVSEELARRDDDLAELVDAGARSFGTLAERQDELRATVRRLPPTLTQATSTLRAVDDVAQVLRPTAQELLPVVPRLDASNTALRELATEAAPLVRDDVRPFVRSARPAFQALRKTLPRIRRAEPGLLRTLQAFNTQANLLGFNPRGAEGPDVAGREEGYLFHTAWAAHQQNSVFGWADAHGFGRKAAFGGTCKDLRELTEINGLAEFGLGLTFLLRDPRTCGGQP